MKRLIFHVGIHKTGTTYLQGILHAGRERLAEPGICYPELDNNFAHHQLGKSLLNLSATSISPFWLRLKECVESTSYSTYLISTESLDLCQQTDVHRLKEMATELEVQVEIVFFIRNQIDFANSVQLATRDVSKLMQTTDWRIDQTCKQTKLDFPFFIEMWSREFGSDNVRVSTYESASNLLKHFFELIRCSIDITDIEFLAGLARRRNPSRNARTVMFLKDFLRNCSDPPRTELFKELNRHLSASESEVLSEFYQASAGQKTTLFTEQQRATLARRFESSNRVTDESYVRLSDEYFTSDRDFETILSPDPVYNRRMAEMIASRRISSELLNCLGQFK